MCVTPMAGSLARHVVDASPFCSRAFLFHDILPDRFPASDMVASTHLQALWLRAPDGCLSPWQQARALAFREASRELHGGKDMLDWIARRLLLAGGGHPQKACVCKLFKRVDADPDWFPGKLYGAKRGRKALLTPAKRRCIAQSAMSAKRTRGEEPCIAAVVHACPRATRNPQTGQVFCDKTIRKVFLEDCYDFDPEHPWRFQAPLQKVFLPVAVKEHRVATAKLLLQQKPDPVWWMNNVVWFDPCCSVIPGSQAQYDRMRQACKGNRRYISDDAKMYSQNMRGPATAQKQRGWEGRKINWFMVVTRGVVHVEAMPSEWRLGGEGLAAFVERLPALIRTMVGPGRRLPRVVFTDRGTGMYNPHGKIVREYAQAIAAAGLQTYWGADASSQSPDMPDLLMHETAVAWFRNNMKKERPVCAPWEETQAQWLVRARRVTRYVNDNYDVYGLCHAFPKRLNNAVGKDGDRLRT